MMLPKEEKNNRLFLKTLQSLSGNHQFYIESYNLPNVQDTHTVKVGEIMTNYMEVRTLSNFLYSIQITETE